MRRLQQSVLANQSIVADLLVATYTATADRALMIRIALTDVVGGGDYSAYITLQQAGAGVWYKTHVATLTAAAAVLSLLFPSIVLAVENTDVVRVYVKGLAGDGANVDSDVRFYAMDYMRPTTVDRTLDVAATGEAGLDFDNVKAATAPTTLTNITVPVVTAISGTLGTLDALWTKIQKWFRLALRKDAAAAADYAAELAEINANGGSGAGAYASTTDSQEAVRDTAPLGSAMLTAADVWAYATRTLSSFGTLVADVWSYTTRTLTSFGTALAGVAAAVWAYATRTLTQSPSSTADPADGSIVTRTRGDDWSIALTGLGSLAGHTEIWFTMKDDADDADSESRMMVKHTTGLAYLNRAALVAPVVAADASLSVDDEAAGDISIPVKARATQDLPLHSYGYDVQWKTATGAIYTLVQGRFIVGKDQTRAVS